MHVTIGIATTGRRAVLSQVLGKLTGQTRMPDELIVCPATDEDVDREVVETLPFAARIIPAPMRGLPAQRNAILRAASGSDVVIFFDDDFVPAADFVAVCESVLADRAEVVMLTGEVLADGVYTQGIPFEEALRTLAADRGPSDPTVEPIYNCYGCNMALRLAIAVDNRIEFDENLPLYAWLEDVDFSRQMSPFGGVVKANACRGVHMATKKGKGSGVRLGYSQIANPIYLARKGTMSLSRATVQISRNVTANLAKVLRPEPWVDRRGRVAGNLLALRDVLTGRLHPRRIETIR